MRCPEPITLPSGKDHLNLPDWRTVPCGKCEICLSNQRSEWTFRLSQELKASHSGDFITLTYDAKKTAKKGISEHNLDKAVVQKFLKRLRRKIEPERFRYYLSGEYGPQTGRAHYHGIFFNLPRNIIDKIPEIWGLGTVTRAPLTPERLNYTTSYIINKYEDYGDKQAPFSLMSRKPGLGHTYLDTKFTWHKDHKAYYVQWPGGQRQQIPRYYKDKLFTKWDNELNAITTNDRLLRKEKEEIERIERLDNNYLEYRKLQYEQARQKIRNKSKDKKL